MGLEPTTSSLGSWHSTTELRPPSRQWRPVCPQHQPPMRLVAEFARIQLFCLRLAEFLQIQLLVCRGFSPWLRAKWR